MGQAESIFQMPPKQSSQSLQPIPIDDWSIDFDRAFKAKSELEKIMAATSTNSNNNTNEQKQVIHSLQREILLSNPIGRHLLQRQLCNIFESQTGEFIYDPKSIDNLIPSSPSKNSKGDSNSEITNVVVLLSGALNPIHKAHVLALLLGARSIEEQFGIPGNTAWNLAHTAAIDHHDTRKPSSSTSFATHQTQEHDTLIPGKVRVIGCALVPSSDGYVAGKLGKEALKCNVRCEFSEDACMEVTTQYLDKAVKYCLDVIGQVQNETKKEQDGETDVSSRHPSNIIRDLIISAENELEHFFPLFVLPYNQASAGLCCKLLAKEFDDKYNNDEKGNKLRNNKFEVLRLYGSDFAAKYRHYREMVCIERHDKEKSGEFVKNIVLNQKQLVGANFIFVPQDPARDVFGGVANCSSTAVREALQSENREVLSQMLHLPVMEKMILVARGREEREKQLAEEKRKKEEFIAFHKARKAKEAAESGATKESTTKKKVQFDDDDECFEGIGN